MKSGTLACLLLTAAVGLAVSAIAPPEQKSIEQQLAEARALNCIGDRK